MFCQGATKKLLRNCFFYCLFYITTRFIYALKASVLVTSAMMETQSTIDSEGFKGGTRGAPIMPRDAVSLTANIERRAYALIRSAGLML